MFYSFFEVWSGLGGALLSSIPDSWSDWIDWLESAPSGGRWMGRDWIESGRTTPTEDGYPQPSPSNQRSNQGLMPFIDMVKRVALETAENHAACR